MPRIELPTSLGDAFSVAHARSAGVGEGRLRGSDLERRFHGARLRVAPADGRLTPWERERAELQESIAAYLPVMPAGAWFTGPTAAALWGLPLPLGLTGDLHVAVAYPRTPPRRLGVRGTRVVPGMAGVVDRGGVPVADPATTWAALGGMLLPYDLVAVADAMLRVPRHPGGYRPARERPLATRDELAAALIAGRRRGAADLRRALTRARTGAASRPESWTRLILVDAGLPEPDLDVDVVGEHGEFLGCLDLAYPRHRVGIEYEGDGHLTRPQLERDIDKYAALGAAGWQIIRLTSHLVFRVPNEAVRRVRAALER
ncbi:hypothetical protein ABZ477_12075 [Microbacterium sp. NPDC019599]|uniref:endonuclease domain-containing protein n=1 Tax=Microbacterium sp. NPDC019599 TaxID=3154690 RepID=UPI0033D16958